MAQIIRISKEEAERRLSNVPEGHMFWCCDGSTLRSMRDLEEAFYSMKDEIFAYHSNEYKNDFSNWVNDIIGDDKLARDLLKAHDKVRAAKFVSDRIAFLSAKLS
jgi:hypothetical protein